MAKKKDIQQCEYYEICDARLHPHSSTDKPNMAAHLGFRCVYVLISWFILSYKINEGFFTTMFLFSLPIFMDSFKFVPQTKLRRCIRYVSLTILGLWCLFSLVGILGVLQLDMSAMTISTSKEFISFSFHNVGISFICNALLSVVFITIVDWLQGDSKLCS